MDTTSPGARLDRSNRCVTSSPASKSSGSFVISISPSSAALLLVIGQLAGADRHRQPVLARGDGAAPLGAVGAIGVVGQVEVEEQVVVVESVRLEVAAGAVGLPA